MNKQTLKIKINTNYETLFHIFNNNFAFVNSKFENFIEKKSPREMMLFIMIIFAIIFGGYESKAIDQVL